MISNLSFFKREVGRIRGILMESLPWSPLDFIRDISPGGDKAIFVEHLTREVDEDNDLRFIDRFPNSEELVVFAEKLPWDSSFFGYGVAKLSGIYPLAAPYHRPWADYTDAFKKLLEESRNRGIKYLFAQIDPRDLATLRSLGRLGFSLIETRVYYHMSLKNHPFNERYPVRVANANDIEALGRTAQETVNLYDRFHADPFIKKEDADRLMYKWIEASVLESFADVTIVPDFPHPTAFCTVKYHKNNWLRWNLKLSQTAFSAVSSECKGWFKKLISEIIYHLKEIGAEHTYYVTQITNKPVAWVLEGAGYHFGRGEHILRIIL